MGHEIIIWTIRISMSCYALFLWLNVVARSRNEPFLRGVWTTACAIFLVHVAAAFHFQHHWDHQAAIENTARRTQEVMGQAYGEGIYFSHLFLLIWVLDVIWWWLTPDSYRNRDPLIGLAIHGYMFFIAINGTIVFETGPTRWLGVPFLLILSAAFIAIRSWPRNQIVEQASS